MPLSVFHGYDIKADILVTVLWAAAAMLFFGRSLRLGRLDFAAWAALIFLVLYETFPDRIGTTSRVDGRLLPALVVCILAWLGGLPFRWSWTGMVLLVAALGVRDGDIFLAWHRLDARLRDEARSFAFIEPNSSVLPLILLSEYSKEHPEAHFANLAVIERHAYSPALFAVPDQQPLQLTGVTQLVDSAMSPPLLSITPLTSDGRFELSDPAAAAKFDYLWVYNPVMAKLDFPVEWGRVFETERVTLWRRREGTGSAETTTKRNK
jgi:hypothetical protein